MNSFINNVRLMGNLGMKPETRELSNHNKMARFSLAIPDQGRNGDEERTPQWHNIIAWGRQAELAEKLLNKGMQVAIEGQLKVRSYTDKDGIKRTVTEIQADSILLVSQPKP